MLTKNVRASRPHEAALNVVGDIYLHTKLREKLRTGAHYENWRLFTAEKHQLDVPNIAKKSNPFRSKMGLHCCSYHKFALIGFSLPYVS